LIARELAQKILPKDRILLEGAMGVGKSTFARALLSALGVQQTPEGSPTFAIAHEYCAPRGGLVHIDFYRLHSEEEIEEAGISSYFWERELIVICEWISSWPDFERAVMKSIDSRFNVWQIHLAFRENNRRDIIIEKYSDKN